MCIRDRYLIPFGHNHEKLFNTKLHNRIMKKVSFVFKYTLL